MGSDPKDDKEDGQYWSHIEGAFHGDTQKFDDMDELGEPKKLELIEVNFYHDDDDIFGMMTVYDNGEEEIELPHKPKKTPSNLKTL